MAFSAREFRDALGRFATGVCVVTCPADGAAPAIGMTVNSFTSVSLNPPLVLWCVDKNTDRFARFNDAPGYAVNMLAHDQHALSVRFAGDGRMDGLAQEHWQTGAPVLAGTLAAIDCQTVARHDAGDHVILVGQVLALRAAGTDAPLLFYQGAYSSLSPL